MKCGFMVKISKHHSHHCKRWTKEKIPSPIWMPEIQLDEPTISKESTSGKWFIIQNVRMFIQNINDHI